MAGAVALTFTAGNELAHGQDADPKLKDFSRTNSVSLFLAEAQRGKGPSATGLSHYYLQGGDGRTTLMAAEGVACRCLDLAEEGHPKGYLYFTLDPTFKANDVSKVRIEVDYFDGLDGQLGVFGVQYDATGAPDGYRSKELHPSVPLKGTKQWLKATFHIEDATFRNSENGGSDFRLWVSPPEICVSRVTVTREPEGPPSELRKPAAFNAAGEATLGEWNVQWDAGEKPSFSNQTGAPPASRWLEVRLPNAFAAGSWRTSLLLEPGAYTFAGRVRTQGVGTEGDGNSGVALRASGRSSAKRVGAAPDGTTLSYDFVMPSRGYVELVCEFLGDQGSARFDLNSLKLMRKGKAAE